MTPIILIATGLGFVALFFLAWKGSGERLWDPLRPNQSDLAWLEIRDGAPVGKWLALTDSSLTIGRNERNRLVIDDPAVAGQHAAVTPFHGGWAVRDFSGGGVVLNEMPIRYGGVRLRPGDTIEIGPVRLRYHQAPPPAWATVHTDQVKLVPASCSERAQARPATRQRALSHDDLRRVVRFFEQELENNRREI
jgi:hypothetical protein